MLFIAALEQRGVPSERIDDRGLVFRLDEPPPSYRVVLNRCISQTRGLHLSRIFEAGGVPVVSSSQAIASCDDRVAMHLALAAAELPMPPTAVALAPARRRLRAGLRRQARPRHPRPRRRRSGLG